MRNVFGRRTAAMIVAAAMLGIVAPEINAETLPRHAPVPEISPRPVSKPETQASGNQEPEAHGSSQSTRKLETPVTAPIPEKRPSPPDEAGSEDGKSSKGTDATPTPGDGTSGNGKTESPSPSTEAAIPPEAAPVPSPKPPEPRKVLLRPTPPPPPARFACRADLRKLGVRFEEKAPLSNPESGCSVPNPIAVSALSSSVEIGPEAVMNCALADELAHFITGTASPIAKKVFGSPIKALRQASAYVCRDRHGTSTVSEHAFGNAIDIAEFLLEDGTKVEVKDYGDSDPKRTEFLNEVRAAACGPFRTVLGPGADPDHSLHFHFDLEPRKSKNAFCQ